jgi:hypothetical protein
MAVNFEARDLGKALGKMSQEQARIQENIYPDDPDAQLLLQIPHSVTLGGSIIGAAWYYPTNSFILDHAVYGYVDSSVLLIDGGYQAGTAFSVAPAAANVLSPTSASHYFAQAITPSTDLWVTGVTALMTKTGSPSGNVTLMLCSLNSGSVSMNLVSPATSATVAASSISGSALYSANFSFPPVRLVSGTGYTINVVPVYTDGSNYTSLYQTSTDVYSGGTRYTSVNSGTSWVANIAADLGVGLLCASGSLLFSTTL